MGAGRLLPHVWFAFRSKEWRVRRRRWQPRAAREASFSSTWLPILPRLGGGGKLRGDLDIGAAARDGAESAGADGGPGHGVTFRTGLGTVVWTAAA
jgi:hypothetical protein